MNAIEKAQHSVIVIKSKKRVNFKEVHLIHFTRKKTTFSNLVSRFEKTRFFCTSESTNNLHHN